MAIFPEGTRSRGPRLGTFHNGSFKLATKAEATILPVTIQGSYKVWEEFKRIKPARVALAIGKPIPTRGMSVEERKHLPERVRQSIELGLSGDAEPA